MSFSPGLRWQRRIKCLINSIALTSTTLTFLTSAGDFLTNTTEERTSWIRLRIAGPRLSGACSGRRRGNYLKYYFFLQADEILWKGQIRIALTRRFFYFFYFQRNVKIFVQHKHRMVQRKYWGQPNDPRPVYLSWMLLHSQILLGRGKNLSWCVSKNKYGEFKGGGAETWVFIITCIYSGETQR